MVFLLLFLIIASKHGLAINYDVYAPDDYLNYHRTDDIKITDDITDTSEDKVKYNELLSLLHNDYSNTALLSHISNPVNDRTLKDNVNTTNKVIVLNSTEILNDNRKVDDIDGKRMIREDNVTEKEIVNNLTSIPLDSNSNKLRRDNDKASDIVIEKSELDFKDVKRISEDLNILNKQNDTDEVVVKGDLNHTRQRRHTALKLLRDLFHHTSIPPNITKSVIPRYLRQNRRADVNSTFADLIQNLTTSIKIMNEHLANLKLHVNENIGFVMIKVPISNVERKRYLSGIEGDKNLTKSINDNVRAKRDLAVNSDEHTVNATLEKNTTVFNVTKNDNNIIDTKEKIERTIISDSEHINKLSELNKSKRDLNTTNIETEYLSTGKANATEKSVEIHSKRSNVNNTAINCNETESNNTRLEHTISNGTNSKDVNETSRRNNPNETSRRFLDSTNDIFFSIEKTYGDIKSLITPMNDIKDKYSNAILYKIGYIIANLDTMEMTLKKLSYKILKNALDAKRLQKILKKLRMTKKLVANVMRYLNKYAYLYNNY